MTCDQSPTLGDLKRMQECKDRTITGSCNRVNALLEYTAKLSLNECDRCWQAGPDTSVALTIRRDAAEAMDDRVLNKGLWAHKPRVISALFRRRPEATASVLSNQLPLMNQQQVEALADALPPDVALTLRHDWRAVSLKDNDVAMLSRGCIASRLLSAFGSMQMGRLERYMRTGEFEGFIAKAEKNPTYSVCIAVLNEGKDLELTVASLVAAEEPPLEIILVDDGSKEDAIERVRPLVERWGIKFVGVKHPRRLGSGPSKHEAAGLATGDIIVVMDSHMKVPWEWFRHVRGAYQTYPTAVLWAASVGFDESSWHGRHTKVFYDQPSKCYSVQWDDPPTQSLPATHPTPAPCGACYIIPRTIYKRIGGYAPLLRGWGREEEWLAFRAWITGCEVRCISGLKVPHQYRRTVTRTDVQGNNPEEWMDAAWNSWLVMSCAYEDQKVFDEVHGPALLAHHGERYNAMRPVLDEYVAAFRDFLSKVRRRTDEEVREKMGIQLSAPRRTDIPQEIPRVEQDQTGEVVV